MLKYLRCPVYNSPNKLCFIFKPLQLFHIIVSCQYLLSCTTCLDLVIPTMFYKEGNEELEKQN